MPSPISVASVTAVAVAVRGPGSNSDSSPNISPGPMTASRFSRPSAAVRPSFTLPLGDDVEPVTRVALGEQRLAAGQAHLDHLGAQLLLRLRVEGGEQR